MPGRRGPPRWFTARLPLARENDPWCPEVQQALTGVHLVVLRRLQQRTDACLDAVRVRHCPVHRRGQQRLQGEPLRDVLQARGQAGQCVAGGPEQQV